MTFFLPGPNDTDDDDILAALLAEKKESLRKPREFGVSVPTIARKNTELKQHEDPILKYRALQSLELTAIQAEVLDAITPDKIQDASLKDLVAAFKVLKEKELVAEGKPSEIKGLVGYLMHLEKEEQAGHRIDPVENAITAEFSARNVSSEEIDSVDTEEDAEDEERSTSPRSLSEIAGNTGASTGETGESPSKVSSQPLFSLDALPDL